MESLNYETGKRIRSLRNLHNMTQEELADRLDVSIKHVSSVERGISMFSLSNLIALCEVFDCDLDYLVRGRTRTPFSSFLPSSVSDIISSGNEDEIRLFTYYLLMYKELRGK